MSAIVKALGALNPIELSFQQGTSGVSRVSGFEAVQTPLRDLQVLPDPKITGPLRSKCLPDDAAFDAIKLLVQDDILGGRLIGQTWDTDDKEHQSSGDTD